MVYLLVGLNILLLVSGQILWKLGVARDAGFKAVLASFFSPLVLAGLVLYVLATVIWLYVLAREQFSLLYPLQSLAYALGVVVAWLVFKEAVPLTRWIGVLVIMAGVALVAMK
ncbi:EamA family transporter [Neomoorella thermoacetica]|uniref:EamA family transporter n=1 Tax=Neomoorella thermoacetica TaxID=1525 RepID=UPI0008FA6DA1|nr:EamA family transporter [Moorella thermoacetica]OIQ10765.1 4-amino-4-deoxy-L-arabinose-phosphoundecaprenol flippase subunit ArnE [Moorella thermoacetica]